MRSIDPVPKGLRILVVVLLVATISLRFSALDRHVFWLDEVVNAWHVSGYSKLELGTQLQEEYGGVFAVRDLLAYQYPTSETTWLDTIAVLARGEPQSPPLYYLISRWWIQLFGNAIAVARSVSATISLLVFPGMFWLAWEWTRSRTVAWLAMGLVAVSPIQFLFAIEFRPYVLWVVTLLLASATFLRAMRSNGRKSWLAYAASTVVGLYAFPLTGLVTISHGIYVAIIERLRVTKRAIFYLVSVAIALLLYSPWIWQILQIDSEKMSDWRTSNLEPLVLLNSWISNFSVAFVDFNRDRGLSANLLAIFDNNFLLLFLALASIGLTLYAFYVLYRHTQKSIWLFVFLLAGVPAAILTLPDLILGGQRSSVARYFFPCYIGIQLSVAYLFARQIDPNKNRDRVVKFWKVAAAFVLSLGLASCSQISRSPYWWPKAYNKNNTAIAETIEQAENPLVITASNSWSFGNLSSIAYNLDTQTQVMLLPDYNIPALDMEAYKAFLFYPETSFDQIDSQQPLRLNLARQQGPFFLFELEAANSE